LDLTITIHGHTGFAACDLKTFKMDNDFQPSKTIEITLDSECENTERMQWKNAYFVVRRGGGINNVDEESEKEEGESGGKCCWNSAHFRLSIELRFIKPCPLPLWVTSCEAPLVNST